MILVRQMLHLQSSLESGYRTPSHSKTSPECPAFLFWGPSGQYVYIYIYIYIHIYVCIYIYLLKTMCKTETRRRDYPTSKDGGAYENPTDLGKYWRVTAPGEPATQACVGLQKALIINPRRALDLTQLYVAPVPR